MLQQQTHEERRGLAPVLVLLKGQPGCGKSTLATALAAKLRWPLIDKDDARSPCQHLVAAHPTLDFNQLAYDVMWRVCERQLCCGLSIVVDCPLARRELFDRAAGLADQVCAQE
jgi:predicted kinase